MAWSRDEVEAIVADYFHMLLLELSGQTYNKSARRRTLLKKLGPRTEAAVELKHQNISAVLIELGYPHISGYKPRNNYQALLREVIENRLEQDTTIDAAALSTASTPAQAPLVEDFTGFLVAAPAFDLKAAEARTAYIPKRTPQKRDYVEREARHRSQDHGLWQRNAVLHYPWRSGLRQRA
jgi:hypothetical protein